MDALLAFAVTLMLAVLISERAERTVLSTAVLFLVAGFLVGDGVLGLVPVDVANPFVGELAKLALVSILFTDGMKIGLRDLLRAWSLPGRALLLGLPLTLLFTALLARVIVGLPWAESFLIGGVLCPTDPVFAAAIVGREEVPERLRHLLNVESGLNDGLALPIVVSLLAIVGRAELHPWTLAGEVLAGVAVGVAIPLAAIRLERSHLFATHATYAPLNGLAIGLLVLSVAWEANANEFLAAFSAGITIATVAPEIRESFHRFGELLAELLKLAALFVFGALMTPAFFTEISPRGYLFALLVLVAVRPLAMAISLAFSDLDLPQRAVASWFGPKGFASVVFGLLILKHAEADNVNWQRADRLFHLIALCITASILAHSSTDVPVARWFRKTERSDPQDRDSEPHEQTETAPSPGR